MKSVIVRIKEAANNRKGLVFSLDGEEYYIGNMEYGSLSVDYVADGFTTINARFFKYDEDGNPITS